MYHSQSVFPRHCLKYLCICFSKSKYIYSSIPVKRPKFFRRLSRTHSAKTDLSAHETATTFSVCNDHLFSKSILQVLILNKSNIKCYNSYKQKAIWGLFFFFFLNRVKLDQKLRKPLWINSSLMTDSFLAMYS